MLTDIWKSIYEQVLERGVSRYCRGPLEEKEPQKILEVYNIVNADICRAYFNKPRDIKEKIGKIHGKGSPSNT